VRYEHLTLDISTAALADLRLLLAPTYAVWQRGGSTGPAHRELVNLFNEIEARLQRRDQDPTAPCCLACGKPGRHPACIDRGYQSNEDLTS
jgi:hypothetical protein